MRVGRWIAARAFIRVFWLSCLFSAMRRLTVSGWGYRTMVAQGWHGDVSMGLSYESLSYR